MAQNTGLSRGSQKNKQFIQDSANSFIVDAFQDMSLTAPGSPVDGEGYITENTGALDASWGTITGLVDGDIIRYRASKSEWQIVAKAVAANQGFKAYVKDEDTLYALDSGAEWAIASGSGGGVKNFAQKQATSYKPGDWVKGNDPAFGTLGAGFRGELSVETVAPLDGKKSFKYITAATSGNDWFYLLVDIDQYARGGVIAFTLDYTWDGDEDIRVHIWDPTFTNEYTNELNVIKNTTNDDKASRNSRTVYAQPSDESQVVVGFQIATTEGTGKVFTFDNLKVTDDIGVIGSGGSRFTQELFHTSSNSTLLDGTTELRYNPNLIQSAGDSIIEAEDDAANTRTKFVATVDCVVNVSAASELAATGNRVDIWRNGAFFIVGDNTYSTGIYTQVSANMTLKAGEFFTIRVTSPVAGGGASVFSINATAQQEGLRFLQVPNGEKLKDTFTARVGNNGTASIISDPYGFIDSVSRLSLGVVRVNFKPGFFSQIPAVTFTAEQPSGYPWPAIQEVTNSYVIVMTTFHEQGVVFRGYDVPFGIYVTKQETSPDVVGVPVSIQGQTHEQDSYIRLNTRTGTIGTNTCGWGNLIEAGGNAITYDASQGTFTVEQSGVYTISYSGAAGGGSVLGISKNSTTFGQADDTTLASSTWQSVIGSLSWEGYLTKGDVIRAGVAGGFTTGLDSQFKFSMAKVGTQPLLDGGLVERPGSTLFVQNTGSGAAGYGSSSTNYRRFTNILESSAVANGDVLYTDSATDGMSVEILEDGVYNVSVTHAFDTSGSAMGISVNAPIFSPGILDIADGNRVCHDGTSTAGEDVCASATRLFRKGDIIRVHSQDAALNVTVRNNRCFFSITKLGQTVKYSSRVYKEDPIAWQRKDLNGDLTGSGTSSDLSFNNLEIGKTYRISGSYLMQSSGNINISTNFTNGSNVIFRGVHKDISGAEEDHIDVNLIFTATGTSLDFNYAVASGKISALTNYSYIQLEELPFHAQTSKWT